jgi:MraZ protein
MRRRGGERLGTGGLCARLESGAVRGRVRAGSLFISTFEKQLDAKRRIVAPQEFRAAVAPLDGLFCFPSVEADCIEGGGRALFDSYAALIEEYPFGDPTRTALETSIMGGMTQLAFDVAGRVTLPESLCEAFGLKDWVTVVGLGGRFQIWPREAWRSRSRVQRELAREGLLERARRVAVIAHA